MVKDAAFVLCLLGVAITTALGNPDSVEGILGAKGIRCENVLEIRLARTNLQAVIDREFRDVASRAEFHFGKRGTSLHAEMAVLQDEANDVLTVAFENGLNIVGLHHQHFFDEPRVMSLRVSGVGIAEKLAEAVLRMQQRIERIRKARPKPPTTLGGPPVKDEKSAQTRTMSAHTKRYHYEAALSGNDDNAAMTGFFTVQGSQLQMLTRALRHWDVNITALYYVPTTQRYEVRFMLRAKANRLDLALKTALETLN